MLRGDWYRLRDVGFKLALKSAAIRFEFAQILFCFVLWRETRVSERVKERGSLKVPPSHKTEKSSLLLLSLWKRKRNNAEDDKTFTRQKISPPFCDTNSTTSKSIWVREKKREEKHIFKGTKRFQNCAMIRNVDCSQIKRISKRISSSSSSKIERRQVSIYYFFAAPVRKLSRLPSEPLPF